MFGLALRAARVEIQPFIAYHRLRMINMWHTPIEPLRTLVAEMLAEEASGDILSLSFAHGFPWGDVAHVGAMMVAISEGDAAACPGPCDRLGEAHLGFARDDAQDF